jgi:hypothetical protein
MRARVLQMSARAAPSPTQTPAPRAVVAQTAVVTPLAVARSATVHRAVSRRALPPAPMKEAPNAKPVWDTANGGATAGTSFAGDGGTGAAGVGAQANGGDAAGADQPCGFVEFSDPHGSQYDPHTRGFWVDIRMSVHFADGSSQSVMLDYPWYYPSEAANPWSSQNAKDLAFPTRFEAPPAAKAVGEPPLVKYVLEHSSPEGLTLLRDCPQAAATPSS